MALSSMSLAYKPIPQPSMINSTSSFHVSSVVECSKEFQESSKQSLTSDFEYHLKQIVLGDIDTGSNNHYFLLDASTGYEAYSLNVTIDNTIYPLLIDTASPYVWLFGDECQSDLCLGKQLYTGSLQLTLNFSLAYSSSSASGDIQLINMSIGDDLQLQHFNVGVADFVPDIFEDYDISGVIGLPSNNQTSLNGLKDLVKVLYQDENAIDLELFTIMLNNGSSNYDGLLSLGSIVEELYTGNISYTDIVDNDQSYWKMEIDSIYIDDFPVDFSINDTSNSQPELQSNASRLAIVDSGTTTLVLNQNDAAVLHSFFDNSISDGTNFAIYCNETKIINLQIGEQNFSITRDYYMGVLYPTSSKYSGYCVSNFQGIEVDNGGSWIVGGVFLKSVYTIFDYAQQRIGFANKNFADLDMDLVSTSLSSISSVSSVSSTVSTTSEPHTMFSNTTTTHTTHSSSLTTSISSISSTLSNTTNSTNTSQSANLAMSANSNCVILAFSIIIGLIVI